MKTLAFSVLHFSEFSVMMIVCTSMSKLNGVEGSNPLWRKWIEIDTKILSKDAIYVRMKLGRTGPIL